MDSARATSFGAWADEYDEWRPTYPDAAVDWLVPPAGAPVAEVGAGTGKLTDRLVERRLDLDVVEPDGRMLALIRRRHPEPAHPRSGGHQPPARRRVGRRGRRRGCMALVPQRGGRRRDRSRAAAERLARLYLERADTRARVGVEGTQTRPGPAASCRPRPAGPPRALHGACRAAVLPLDVDANARGVERLRFDGLPRPTAARGRAPSST